MEQKRVQQDTRYSHKNPEIIMTNEITDAQGQTYTIGEYIDKGSFSEVYVLKCCTTEKQFAGKFVSKEKLNKYGISHKVWDEIKIHQYLRHKHIVQFHAYIERELHIVIVLEYCSKYSLMHVLNAAKTLRPSEAKYFMLQIVSAVEYLHRNHIVHRDLKLGNSFLNDHFQVKLGDFGLAVVIEFKGQRRTSRCGTPNYIAPEVIDGKGHSYEVDVWALGCVLYTLLEGTPPFQGVDTTATYGKILRCEYRLSSDLDNAAKQLIMNCLQTDPNCRPRAFELVLSEFLSGEVQPEIPKVNLEEYKALSASAKKRKKLDMAAERDSKHKLPIRRRFPFNCLAELSNLLSDVGEWPVSTFVSSLFQVSTVKPPVWINCWIDFSNSCGFAYQLSNGNIGLIFNDGTRLLLINNKTVHYVKESGSAYVFSLASSQKNLLKKMNALLSCGRYMRDSLIQAHKEEVRRGSPRASVCSTEVFAWARTDAEAVMFLSNGSFQVNFIQDHAKLILCPVTGSVTLIDGAASMRTYDLDALRRLGCGADLRRKLVAASRHLDDLLAH